MRRCAGGLCLRKASNRQHAPSRGFRPLESSSSPSPLRLPPTLHVWGARDQVVLPAASQSLACFFQGETLVLDNHGHAVPSTPFAEEVLVKYATAAAAR